MNPKVTVIMPVYNGEKYLREAIESILNQTLKDFEFLIINDGSTDDSVNIIKSYSDKRIRLLDNIKNKGLIFTRNKGLFEAKGEYVAMLDCDDVSYPNRLERQLIFMEKNRDVVLVGSVTESINERGESLFFSFQICKKEEMAANLLFGNCITQSSVMARKEVLLSEGGYNNFPISEDYDLWVRISKKNKIWNLPEVLIKYRIHSSSIGHTEKGKMVNISKEIFKNQLMDLGINPTEEELNTHFAIGSGNIDCNKDFFIKADLWLNKLKRTNEFKKIYEQDIFLKTLNKYWLKIFISCNKISIWHFKFFMKSNLSNCKFNIINSYVFFKKFILAKLFKYNIFFNKN